MHPQANDNETPASDDRQLARALAHPLRARLFEELGRRPLKLPELAIVLDTSLSKVAYHCGVLEEAGGVTRDEEGGKLTTV
jgi:DNA-binding transcriptional ArsR family regulator